MKRIVLNLVGFQIAWWACVLSARGGMPWIGLTVTAIFVATHLFISPLRRFETWFIPAAAALGYAADNVATLVGALEFNNPMQPILPAPLWILAMWLAFATTLNLSLSWMRDRYLVAMLVGAASGPISYGAGAALNIVAMPRPEMSVIVLAVLWGATLPALMYIGARAARRRPQPGALQTSAGGAT